MAQKKILLLLLIVYSYHGRFTLHDFALGQTGNRFQTTFICYLSTLADI